MSKPISQPTLPQRAGYVEIEDDGGNRVYMKIENDTDAQIAALIQQNADLSTVLDAAQTSSELALAELAEAQETTQTSNELALAELADLIAGGGVS